MRHKFVLMVAGAVLCAGCSVGPDYVRPTLELPEEFSDSRLNSTEASAALDLARWWESFEDSNLNELVHEALAANLDLQRARARVRQARAEVSFARSEFFPVPSPEGSYSRSRSSENATDPNQEGVDSSREESSGVKNLYDARIDAVWEIDIFGGTRRAVEATVGEYEAERDAERDTLVSLISEVGLNYFTLRSGQSRIDVLKKTIATEGEALEIQRTRFSAGLTNDLSVAQAEALLTELEAELPALEYAVAQSVHRLGVLLGKEPRFLTSRLAEHRPIPRGPPSIPAGIPADLLRRRPDIRRAENLLAAATAEVGVAVAEYFPKVALTGNIGYRSRRTGNLFDSGSRFWAFGPEVQWHLLNWSAVSANVRLQDARQQEALATYRQSVLLGLEDVENSLIRHDREQERYELLQKSVDSNRRALDAAQTLYDAGLADFLNVVTAQRALYEAEDRSIQSGSAVGTNLILLYKALGGGWDFSNLSPSS